MPKFSQRQGGYNAFVVIFFVNGAYEHVKKKLHHMDQSAIWRRFSLKMRQFPVGRQILRFVWKTASSGLVKRLQRPFSGSLVVDNRQRIGSPEFNLRLLKDEFRRSPRPV